MNDIDSAVATIDTLIKERTAELEALTPPCYGRRLKFKRSEQVKSLQHAIKSLKQARARLLATTSAEGLEGRKETR